MVVLHFEGRRLRGRRPFAVFESQGAEYSWRLLNPCADFPFRSGTGDALDELRCALHWSRERFPSGAAAGFFAYDFARHLEPRAFTEHSAPDDLHIPDARLVFYEEWENSELLPLPSTRYAAPSAFQPPIADERYIEDIERIKNFIEAGDIYQANLTRRFSQRCEYSADELFQRLFAAHPTPFSALLSWDDFSIVSNSPERFFSVKNRILTAQPIKGTARRGGDASEDELQKAALLASEKDRAENVMIVDLLRNDLGRVCEFGSVRVPELCALHTFPTLHHLVSMVTGTLRANCDALDAMRALFPCGSITGAPKIRAMQILDEMELSRRGAAMGAIGYFAFNGDADWNVVIRTITLKNGTAHFHVGGGITWGSEAQSEYSEMMLKAQALQRALD